ncbi:MAG: PKD domain-containing protein [Gemmatimonadetes bacterium]|nr:PKD domain-containing protein [Gemmatimonadota bacterium]
MRRILLAHALVLMSAVTVACRTDETVAPLVKVPVSGLAQRYGPLGNTVEVIGQMMPHDVNAAGTVVGQENVNAVMYPPLALLPNLTGTDYYNWAAGINDAGAIAGGRGWPLSQVAGAFHMDPAGVVTWLAALPNSSTGTQTIGVDLNDAGELVGTSMSGTDPQAHPVVWTTPSAAPVDLGWPAGSAGFGLVSAMAPGLSGTQRLVVGAVSDGTANLPVMWNGTTPAILPSAASDIGPYGGARDAGDNGMVVGFLQTAGGGVRPIVWLNGTVHADLGALCQQLPGSGGSPDGGIEGVAVTPSGQTFAVGICWGTTTPLGVVFYTDASGQWQVEELTVPPGHTWVNPLRIAASGWIVGTTGGGTEALRWQFTPPSSPNLPPLLQPLVSVNGAEGALLGFGANASDPEGQPLTYVWDFGDGATGSGASPSHTYADNGSYNVQVTVSDGVHTTSGSTTATISNVAPSGVPSAPTTAQVGVPFTISLAATDQSPVDAAALQYRFNCGSGFGPVTNIPSTSCTQATAGTYLLRFSVRDKDGAITGYQRNVTVTSANVAPVVTLTSPSTVTVPVGTAVTISGSFVDAAADAPWTGRVFWGAGQPTTSLGSVTPGQALSGTRTFTVSGTYAARLEVKDTHGATGRANVTIVVQ